MFFAKKRKELEERLEELAAELSLTKKELAEAHRALDDKRKDNAALLDGLEEAKKNALHDQTEINRLSDELNRARKLIQDMEENAAKSIGNAFYQMMNGEQNEMEVTPWATSAKSKSN